MPDSIDNFKLRSDEIQDMLSAVPSWIIMWGNSLILSIIVCILILSCIIKYPDIVTGKATLTTKIEPAMLYANSSGNVDSILVENGDIVKKGEVLLEMNNT